MLWEHQASLNNLFGAGARCEARAGFFYTKNGTHKAVLMGADVSRSVGYNAFLGTSQRFLSVIAEPFEKGVICFYRQGDYTVLLGLSQDFAGFFSPHPPEKGRWGLFYFFRSLAYMFTMDSTIFTQRQTMAKMSIQNIFLPFYFNSADKVGTGTSPLSGSSTERTTPAHRKNANMRRGNPNRK